MPRKVPIFITNSLAGLNFVMHKEVNFTVSFIYNFKRNKGQNGTHFSAYKKNILESGGYVRSHGIQFRVFGGKSGPETCSPSSICTDVYQCHIVTVLYP
jgi:hypothetical protein